MKKIFTYSILAVFLISCTSESSETNEESIKKSTFNKLKAYNKIISFYYYSPINEVNGKSRVYLDTINSVLSQYTRVQGQSDLLEEFSISESTIYQNYNNSNIDYIKYTVRSTKNEQKPIFITLSHKINTDKFFFNRSYINNNETFNDNFKDTEYFKNQNP